MKRKRELILGKDIVSYAGISPMSGVRSIAGIRIYDVGQGDAICVLDQDRRPFLQIDYGGKFANPFTCTGGVEAHMPVANVNLMMLTHWDEDHWCSAIDNNEAKLRPWLVPRQRTSPRAVKFTAELPENTCYCIPERDVGVALSFSALNPDDRIYFEKIKCMPPIDSFEDCNATGVALAIVKGEQVILLPGDAPFDRVSIFRDLQSMRLKLRAVVAFHHGSEAHWTRRTRMHLRKWQIVWPCDVIFSYGLDNSYGHPSEWNYWTLTNGQHFTKTPSLRRSGRAFVDILFY